MTTDDWENAEDTDPEVELEVGDLEEVEAAARRRMDTPSTAPHATLEWLAGYAAGMADGEHRGMAWMLHVVRDHLLEDGADPAWADKIIRALARRAGMKLG